MTNQSMAVRGAPVYGRSGGCLGYAEGVEGGVLLVEGSDGDEASLSVPLEWVVEVGNTVHLDRTCREVRKSLIRLAEARS